MKISNDLLEAYRRDWKLRGKSNFTVNEYIRYLQRLEQIVPEPTLQDVLSWLDEMTSRSSRRMAARAVRSYGKFMDLAGIDFFTWWANVPLAPEEVTPQKTVTMAHVNIARRTAGNIRDHALIELLWATGMRRSEISALQIEDVNLAERSVLIRSSKTGRPRRVPLSLEAAKVLQGLIGSRNSGSLFELSPCGISAVLKRLDLPSAHAWRRGWAVWSLQSGVSEASVRVVAGWSTGAMVSRYTAALAEELAMAEFARVSA